MLKCNRYEDLIMRYFDHDLNEHEQKKLDQHLGSCSNCRLLFSQLGGILGALEKTAPAEPEPHLVRLVMDRIMLCPAQPDNNEQYSSAGLVYGLFAGIGALLLWLVSLAVQDSGLLGLILAGRNYLEVFSGFMVDLQIVYQIAESLFPSEIFTLFFRIQFIFIIAVVMLAFVAARMAFSRAMGGHPDVS